MYRTEIRFKGTMNPTWSDWFQELKFQSGTDDETILYGDLPDMSAVYGVISRLGSLVIKLVSVTCDEVDAEKSNQEWEGRYL
jgi:hypothetical protein